MKKMYSLALLAAVSFSLYAQPFTPVKKVVVEDFTGAWCGYCPDGAMVLKGIIETNEPNVIGIAVHSGDALEVPDGTTIDGNYSISSYPSGLIDRAKFSSSATMSQNRGNWSARATERLAVPPKVIISFKNLSFDTSTRQLSVDINSMFVDTAWGNKRVNLTIVEDSIPATGSLIQHNYISTWGGDPIVGWLHQHTLRDALGGAYGDTGVVPVDVIPYIDYVKTYTYTVPAGWNYNNCRLVATVSHYGTPITSREIINAEETKMYIVEDHTAVHDLNEMFSDMSVYPNPAHDMTKVSFDVKKAGNVTMEVYDVLGSKVAQPYMNFYNAGLHTMDWNLTSDMGTKLSNGVYIIKLKMDGNEVTRRIEIQ